MLAPGSAACSGGSSVAIVPSGSAGSCVAAALSGSGSAGATSSPALSAWSSGGIGTYFFSALAGRNHRPDSPIAGVASGPGAPSVTATSSSDNSASPSGGAVPAPVVPAPVVPAPAPASPSRDSVPTAAGTSPASAESASRVMSSPSSEPVLRSSVSGIALPSSVAGRDGTRLKYRSGIALRTNSRVARKCPPFPVRCQYNAPDRPRVPARAPSRRGPFATCQVSPSRSCPRADRGGSGPDGSPRHYNRAARPGRPNRPRKAFSLNEIHLGRSSLTQARTRPRPPLTQGRPPRSRRLAPAPLAPPTPPAPPPWFPE